MSAQIIPTLRYKNAPAAIEWLCTALGFTKHLIVPGENGTITHAQIIFGNAMIMLGSIPEKEYSDLVSIPEKVNGKNTQSAYIVVDKIEEHYKQAQSAGAVIVTPLVEQDYGGKHYSCTDPEGYLWNFGSYDPWK